LIKYSVLPAKILSLRDNILAENHPSLRLLRDEDGKG